MDACQLAFSASILAVASRSHWSNGLDDSQPVNQSVTGSGPRPQARPFDQLHPAASDQILDVLDHEVDPRRAGGAACMHKPRNAFVLAYLGLG
jgi:hypothetical protein